MHRTVIVAIIAVILLGPDILAAPSITLVTLLCCTTACVPVRAVKS